MQSLNMEDGNAHCGNIIGSFNKTFNLSDEDAQIMHWLSPLQPENRHQGVRTDRFAGIGDWLLETKEFREWRCSEVGADQAVLFCHGNPGVGKTYLSSLVIDSLCDEATKEGIAVAGFYCDYLAQGEQTITNMMRAILKQLVGRGDIPKYVRRAFQEGKMQFGGRRLLLPDLMRMLKTIIAALSQVFICIDALDECLPKHLPELLTSLEEIIRESPNTRIFLTGRAHVGADVKRVFVKAVVIPISPNTDDIRSYLEMKLCRDSEPEAMNDALRADILRTIPEKISEVFLLVSLNIDAILGEVTLRQRRKKLDEMIQGNGLSDAYTATIDRLKAQKGNKLELGLKALMWVSHSEQPLKAEELCHALGVEIGSSDLDIENVPALRTLLACSLGLVTVEASSSTIRLVHYTLREYLSNNLTIFNNPHSTIAQVCLTYLDFRCIRDLSPTLRSAPSTTPFLEYASHYWEKHAKREMTENVKTLTLRLLDGFDRHISANLTLLRYEEDERWGEQSFDWVEGPKGFTGLHGAAFFGLSGILAALLEIKRWNVNATDSTGNTALTWAAGRGHEAVVKMLLNQEGVNPDMTDTKCNLTPLLWASIHGHEGVIKMLLERGDVDVDRADNYGETPLSWAAENGHEGVAKMLLDREDVNVNTADKSGKTPLSWAAEKGREGVAKMLLDREDVNPDTVDSRGQTPILWASCYGYEGIAKMLLDREDVNPDTADDEGRTPLLLASLRGHEGIAKMLLDREDVNVNTADKSGNTPLSWTAENGHEGVAKMLLDREDVNVNTADTKYDRTPLSWAAANGREEVAKMLLDREDVNPDTADSGGLTPLLWASRYGYEGIAKMLLDREDVNVNTADKSGKTPLSWAAEKGREGVAKMFLDREDVNVNTADKSGKTPLSWASVCGHEGVAKMLLDREDVNANTVDAKYGQAPLSWAAKFGHTGVVQMLLDQKDVNSETANNKNQTPLSLALAEGHDEVVKLLLGREKLNSDTADSCGQASLSPSPENYAADMQLTNENLNPDITSLGNQPAHPPPIPPEERQAALNREDSISVTAGSEPSIPPQPPSTRPPTPSSSASSTPDTHPLNTTQSPAAIPVDWYLIVASFVCVLAIIVYVLSSFPVVDLFSFYR